MLISIETHITCAFPGGGGVRTPYPPSGSAHVQVEWLNLPMHALCFCYCLLTFLVIFFVFILYLFKNIFQEHNQSVKQFGSVGPDLGPDFSRRQ